MVGVPLTILGDPNISLEDKLRYLFRLHNDSGLSIFKRTSPFLVLWRLWKTRNNLVFNRKSTTTEEVFKYICLDTEEWLNHLTPHAPIPTTTSKPLSHHAPTRRSKWTPPCQGWVKCNYDASHHEGNRDSGLGWIIRDSQGTFLNGGMGRFQGRYTALQSSWALGYRSVVFEGDSQTLHRALHNQTNNPRLKNYVNMILQWKSMFSSILFNFQFREQNSCADKLAKSALLSPQLYALFNVCPLFLHPSVNNDCNNSF
ncbi:hypothetical protein CARUB_v10006591mg [Capsella rubella]|uniref:RNase H type-1 domain-containing protein n=1 Tax=Capsella rubella TaxID=81985 RepID=R0H0K2_9BRAS|nr:hypothetical protein CARUB_v10006591mg [Capsella rubella]